MSCQVCGRPGSDPCAGCRTSQRIHFLWKRVINPAHDLAALHLLRDCAGALTDLVESQEPHVAGTAPTPVAGAGGPTPEQAAPSAAGEPAGASLPTKVKLEEKEGEKEEQEKAEQGEALPVSGQREEDSSSPEEESEESEEEQPNAKEPEEKPSRFHRGSLSAPLGLKQLPQQLSPSDIREKALTPGQAWFKKRDHGGDSRGSRPEPEPAPRSERPEVVNTPRSPSRPPGGWEDPGRRRSRSRHRKKKDKKDKGNKGKKKRERGRDWYHQNRTQDQEQWRRKQRDTQRRWQG